MSSAYIHGCPHAASPVAAAADHRRCWRIPRRIAEEESHQIQQVRPQIGVSRGGEECRYAEAALNQFLPDDRVRGYEAIVIVDSERAPVRRAVATMFRLSRGCAP